MAADIRLLTMNQWEFFEQVTPRKTLIQNYCPLKQQGGITLPWSSLWCQILCDKSCSSHGIVARMFNMGLNLGLVQKKQTNDSWSVCVFVAAAPCWRVKEKVKFLCRENTVDQFPRPRGGSCSDLLLDRSIITILTNYGCQMGAAGALHTWAWNELT